MFERQLARMYKLILGKGGKPVSCQYIGVGRIDIAVEVPTFGSTVTSICAIGTNEPAYDDHRWWDYYEYDDDYDRYEYSWDDEEVRWDAKLGKRPTENWNDQ